MRAGSETRNRAMPLLRAAFATAAMAATVCTAAAARPSMFQVNLYAQNRPGATGTATFEQLAGGVRIVVNVAGGQNGMQPVHIHTGTCTNLSAVPAYTLTTIVHGNSTTTLSGVRLADLLRGDYVIDVHESSADIHRYVACAPIATPA